MRWPGATSSVSWRTLPSSHAVRATLALSAPTPSTSSLKFSVVSTFITGERLLSMSVGRSPIVPSITVATQ